MWSLVGLVHSYSVFYQLKRVNHESNAIEELSVTNFFEDKSIKGIFIRLGYDVPGLSSTFVTIVQRIEPKILNMPTKR
jgi:hypothetical protein